MREGEGATKEKEKNSMRGSDAKKGNAPLPNKAGDFNPSYVLCRASDGHVYATTRKRPTNGALVLPTNGALPVRH